MNLTDLSLPSPAENLAAEEALLDSCEAGQIGELLRFWESPAYFVVVGYANRIATEVDAAACEAQGIPIFRRCSGGGTVVQGPGCLNYALFLKITEDGPTRSINAANRFIMERNRAALETLLKRPVELQGHTDLVIGGLKFSGNAQRRRKHFLLFHGTILLNFDLSLISRLLPMPSKQPDYREGRTHSDFLTNLGLPAESVKSSLARTWGATAAARSADSHVRAFPPALPTTQIANLVRDKYSRHDWNYKF
jgi:lipoate-protein ligase A